MIIYMCVYNCLSSYITHRYLKFRMQHACVWARVRTGDLKRYRFFSFPELGNPSAFPRSSLLPIAWYFWYFKGCLVTLHFASCIYMIIPYFSIRFYLKCKRFNVQLLSDACSSYSVSNNTDLRRHKKPHFWWLRLFKISFTRCPTFWSILQRGKFIKLTCVSFNVVF